MQKDNFRDMDNYIDSLSHFITKDIIISDKKRAVKLVFFYKSSTFNYKL